MNKAAEPTSTQEPEASPTPLSPSLEEVEAIARICHEAIRAYNTTIEDPALPPWDDAPQWMTMSAVNGVFLHLNAGVLTPQQSHANWMEERKAGGWKYGKVKDEKKRLHPCMVPFDDLPDEQKRKDAIFIAIIRACTQPEEIGQ